MQKPIILLPFIFVYKLVFAIIKTPYNIIKYFSYGLLYISQLFIEGMIWSSYFVYSGFKYNIDGLLTCLKLMNVNVKTISEKQKENKNLHTNLDEIKDLSDTINNIDLNIINDNLIDTNDNIKDISEIENNVSISEDKGKDVIVESIEVEDTYSSNVNLDELKDNVDELKQNIDKLQENIDVAPIETEDLAAWEDAFEDKKEEDKGLRLSDLLDKTKLDEQIVPESNDLDIEIDNKIKNIDYDSLVITEKQLQKLTKDKLKVQKAIKKENEKLAKEELLEEKTRAKEEKNKLKLERKKNLQNKSNDSYVNEKVEFKKPSIFAGFTDLGKKINNIPNLIAKKFQNNDFVKHSRNQKIMKKEALLINFEGEDAKKSDVKIPYQYEVKDKEGKYVKGFFEAFSKVEVHSYLLSEGYEVYSIKTNKWIQALYKRNGVNHTKIKIKDLIFFLTQLSTYLKAGIPLVDALRILARQFKQKKYKRIFDEIVYDLTTGENFSEALLKQNVAFPRLLINMVKTAEMTGELPEVLDDMADYYTESEKTRKQMVTALMYPSLVMIFAIGVITFIMMFVIPQFVEIYETMDASSIPSFTLVVIAVSEFIQKYIIWLLVGTILFILLIMYLYNNVKVFRTVCQWIMMHIPVIGSTIIYNEVTMFTKTFASLLSHNVFITDSMEVLNKITNNEIYKMLILDTITNLARGDKISTAFEGHWAFPVPAYEMLVTGEKTGELAEMMQKVSEYYQTLHAEQVTRIKTFIEPILTVFLTVVVGIIILAVIIPMFNMYQTVQNY